MVGQTTSNNGDKKQTTRNRRPQKKSSHVTIDLTTHDGNDKDHVDTDIQ